jgi:ribulose bisphosphate carboxylase small subunit
MENKFEGMKIYVDFREGGFASGLSVEKRQMIFFKYDPVANVEKFLKVLQKDLRNKDYADFTVTIHLTHDHYERNDTPQHRYILHEGYSPEYSGFEKRPYQHGQYPEVELTKMKRNPRTEMFKAIAEEVRALAHIHAHKNDAYEVR